MLNVSVEAAVVTTAPFQALSDLLAELGSVVIGLPNDIYRTTLDGAVSGSIGEHVRHCLDHVAALLQPTPTGTLSYDHRARGTAVETDPAAALQRIYRLKTALAQWHGRSLDEPIRVASLISLRGDSLISWSTLAREFAFVVSHTIHHQAVIAVLLSLHGYAVPDRFGHSPATPRRN
jgi:hypothetical protein